MVAGGKAAGHIASQWPSRKQQGKWPGYDNLRSASSDSVPSTGPYLLKVSQSSKQCQLKTGCSDLGAYGAHFIVRPQHSSRVAGRQYRTKAS